MTVGRVSGARGFKFQSYVAKRYLRGAEGKSEGRKFLKLVTYISIGGVALGVMTLILALAIVRGFSEEIQSKVIGFGAHVQVESIRDAPLEQGEVMRQQILAVEGVAEAARVIQEFILLRHSARQIEGVSIWGTEEVPGYIARAIIEGSANLDEGVVVGATLARSLGLKVGDQVTAFSVNTAEISAGSSSPRLDQFKVAGIYETSLANFDELYVFAPYLETQDLLEYLPGEVSRIDVRLEEGQDFSSGADRIDAILDFPAIARPITDVYRSLFAWVNLQESIIPLVLSIIVFVAAINIIGTLLMIILEKSPEMGVMASFGASSKTRMNIFLYLGVYIGLAGVAIGEVLALGIALLQSQYGLIPLPADAYYMDTAPISLSGVDFALVAILTLILCAVSSWIPARYAARISPIRAIRSR